jgi:hypothetical protein
MTTTAPTRCNDQTQKPFAPGETYCFRRSVNFKFEYQARKGALIACEKIHLIRSDRRQNSSSLIHGCLLHDSPLVTVDISHMHHVL